MRGQRSAVVGVVACLALVTTLTTAVVGLPAAAAPVTHRGTAPTYTWPEFHGGPSLDGTSADPAVSTADAATLGVAWMSPVGASLESPMVAWNADLGETLAYEGGIPGYLNATDVASGRIVWSDDLGTMITSSPLVEGNNVWIAPAGSHTIDKIDAATGAVECTAPTTYSVLSSPVVADPPGGEPTVYFAAISSGGSNAPVLALSEADCTQEWSFTSFVTSGTGAWDPLDYSVDADGEGLLLFGTADPDSHVYALDAATGALVWDVATYSPGAEDWDVGAGVTTSAPGVNGVADGMAYVEGKDGIFYAIDLTTGAVVWENNFGGNGPGNPVVTNTDALSTPALSGTTLVFGDATGEEALNALTGAVEWTQPIIGTVNSSALIVGPAGGQVVAFGDDDGGFHVLSLATGTPLYTYHTGGPVTSSPADVDGNLLVDSEDGFLYDFAPGGGNGDVPTTAVTAPASGSVLPNPDGSIVLTGTASAPDGVAGVDVQVQLDGQTGPWFDQATGTFANGLSTATATLTDPSATTTSWSLSVPVPLQGGTVSVRTSAVGTNGVADGTAYTGTPGSAADSVTVQPSALAPTVSVTPARMAPGGSVSVSASGFSAGESVTFTAPTSTGGTATLATVTAGPTGTTPATPVTVPAGTAFGPDPVTATGRTSGLAGQGTVYVSVDDPQIGYGPAHTGVAPGPDDVIAHYQAISVTSKLAQQWSVAGQGAFDSTPSVVQGVLYAGDESGNLYAVTETTGQPVFTDALGAPVDTTPAVDGGSVLVATTDGVLHQVDAATGAAGWTRTVGGQPTSPTVSGGTIYVGSSNGTLTAVAEGTGTVEWTRSIGGAVTAAPAVSTSPSAVVVTDQDGTVEALSTAGKVQWTASPGGALTGALVDGKAVVVASSTGAVTDLTLAKGTVVWRASTGSAVTAPPVESYGNLVTVGNAAGVVTYYSAAKGSVVNTQAFFGHPITGITSTQGIILLTSTWGLGMIEGAQYVRMTWLFPRAAGYATAGVFLNGDLFVAGGDGLIRGFTVPGRAMA